MIKTEKFETINIDIDKGIYKVNGRDISTTATELELKFEDGEWSLVVKEQTTYVIRNHFEEDFNELKNI